MPLLSARHLRLSYGGRALLDDAALHLDEGDKVGLVGRNGSGKSSLLACLAGEQRFDSGEVALRSGARVTLLRQSPPPTTAPTLRALVCEAARPARHDLSDEGLQALADTTLSHLGLHDATRPLATASGGTLRRAALAAALVQQPDLLLLDEPTNHLDIESVAWLEQAIGAFPGAVLVVTHDRWFLNQIAVRIAALRDGQISSYPGTFQDYLSQRIEEDAQAARADSRRRNLLARELDWLGRSPAARSTRPKARLERALALAAATPSSELPLQLPDIATERLGKTVLEAHDLRVGHPGGPVVCEHLDLVMARGERLVIVGRNGSGKTTLIRTLLGELPPLAGRVVMGHNTRPLVLDQHRSGLPEGATVREAATISGGDWVQVGNQRQHVGGWLEQWLFAREDFDQPVATLSGGQRFRLLLGRRLQEPANLLVLDEPTNDLDLETLQVIESALAAWQGCALIVSHDRAFVDRIATGLLYLEAGADGRPGTVTRTAGGWAQLLAVRAQAAAAARAARPAAQGEAAPRSDGRAPAPPKLTLPEERELSGIESAIELAEAAVVAAEAVLAAPETAMDRRKIAAAAAHLEQVQAHAAGMWARWQALEAKAAAWNAWRSRR